MAAGRKASEDYTAKRYHQQGDEWQPDWVFAGAARDLEVLYTLGNQLANSRDWPNWSADEAPRRRRQRRPAQVTASGSRPLAGIAAAGPCPAFP